MDWDWIEGKDGGKRKEVGNGITAHYMVTYVSLVCIELLIWKIPHGKVHILHIYILHMYRHHM
jgi:hypothetical protein